MSYDQWKTASPYDDDPDPIEEAEEFLKDHETINPQNMVWPGELERAKWIIEMLLAEI
jgi:hypothetical protein